MSNRALIMRAAMALAVLAAGTPAIAGEMLFGRPEATPLAEGNAGRPYWALLSQCAGIYGAAFDYETGRGRTKSALDAKAQENALTADAAARLQLDRGIERQAALSLVEAQVSLGRADGKAMIDRDGTDSDSAWNWTRSACLDIWSAYRRRLRH